MYGNLYRIASACQSCFESELCVGDVNGCWTEFLISVLKTLVNRCQKLFSEMMRKYICVRYNMFRWLWHIWGVCCFCKRPQKTEEETLQNLCDLYSSTAFCCLELWSPAVMSSTPTHNSQTITLRNLRLSNSNRHLSECCSPVAVWEIPIRLLSPEWAYVQKVPRKGCQKRTFYVGQRLLSVA